jgi:serine/threonine protein kinase
MTSGARIAVKEVALGAGKKGRVQAKSLQQEIRILSELVHPNIINYLGSEYSAGTIRIFLELATEGSIRDVLREFGECSLRVRTASSRISLVYWYYWCGLIAMQTLCLMIILRTLMIT